MIYLIIIFLLLFLSYHYDIRRKTIGRDTWYYILLLIFILLAGLRWRIGVDTPNYLDMYYFSYPRLENFSFRDYPFGKDPLFVLMNSIIKSMNLRFYVVQLVQASFVNILIFKYIKKHSSYIFTCAFFYFITSAYTSYNTEIMRGSMSIVLCLYANDYLMDKKWFKGYLLYFIASLFHVQTIVIFLTPLLFFFRLNKMGLIALTGFLIGGYFLQFLFGSYIEAYELSEDLGDKVSKYMDSEKYGEQKHNLNFFIYRYIEFFYAIYCIIKLKIIKTNNTLLNLEPFVFLGLVFVMMRLSVNICYRYVEYYYIYFIFFYSELFVSLARNFKKERFFSYVVSFVIFLPFFYVRTASYFNGDGRIKPYSSVIERSINKEREETMYDKGRPAPNRNYY